MKTYKTTEVAEMLQMSVRAVQERIRTGELGASNIGSGHRVRYRVSQENLDKYLEKTAVKQAPRPQRYARPTKTYF